MGYSLEMGLQETAIGFISPEDYITSGVVVILNEDDDLEAVTEQYLLIAGLGEEVPEAFAELTFRTLSVFNWRGNDYVVLVTG